MNCCKNLCEKYPSAGRWLSYSSGLMCYCSLCNKTFKSEDITGYKCFCCKAKIRTTPKSKKKREVKRY